MAILLGAVSELVYVCIVQMQNLHPLGHNVRGKQVLISTALSPVGRE